MGQRESSDDEVRSHNESQSDNDDGLGGYKGIDVEASSNIRVSEGIKLRKENYYVDRVSRLYDIDLLDIYKEIIKDTISTYDNDKNLKYMIKQTGCKDSESMSYIDLIHYMIEENVLEHWPPNDFSLVKVKYPDINTQKLFGTIKRKDSRKYYNKTELIQIIEGFNIDLVESEVTKLKLLSLLLNKFREENLLTMDNSWLTGQDIETESQVDV